MSLTFASISAPQEIKLSLAQAILETLAYSDVFDYPLTLEELHKYLVTPATVAEIESCIQNMNQISFKDKYYLFNNRNEIINTREARKKISEKVYKRAFFYGKIISLFPFVRMIGLTGSLAMLNLSKDMDIDFMLITHPKRLWLARAFAVTFGRLMRVIGDRICINLLISQKALHWKEHDLYSAREICQMIPISGFDTHYNFRVVNSWTQEILPNVPLNRSKKTNISWLQKLFELPLLGKIGDKLEKWAMNFQMKIISRQENKSDETNFTPDICQGNFHQHKKWTQIEYEKRINQIASTAVLGGWDNRNSLPSTATEHNKL